MIDCQPIQWAEPSDYFFSFNRKVAQQRIPLVGSIELTRRCNLRCLHCFLAPERRAQPAIESKMPTNRWRSLIDEFTSTGCLELLITGGEPLIREDFPEIYQHARQNGLLVTVFTNGTMVTNRIADVFAQYPPRQVEVSLYGATAATYESITGIEGSFQHCMEGIGRLLDRGINVGVKTMLLTINRHELTAVQELVENMGLPFRFDPLLVPCYDGDPKPLEFRVPAREAAAREFDDERRAMRWRSFYKRQQPATENLQDKPFCGAGLIGFHVDAGGWLMPCQMIPHVRRDLVSATFGDAWRELNALAASAQKAPTEACKECAQRLICGICPAFFMEDKTLTEDLVAYACQLADFRLEAIGRLE